MKEREAQNTGATMYTHWMKTVQENARRTLEQTREAMKKYYDQKATPQPDIETGDLVMLNAEKIKSKRPTRRFTPGLYGPFKVLEKKGIRRSNSISRLAGKSTQYFTSRYSNPIKSLTDPTENNPHESQMTSKVIWNGKWKESSKVR